MLKERKLKNVLNTSSEIRLSGIINESIVDGPGFRYVIFTQGCHKRYEGCHNAKTQPLDGGYLEQVDNVVNDFRKNPIIQGITISGGEPFLQPKAVLNLIKKAKETNLDVIVYSGYYYHELVSFNDNDINEILKTADYLIDGPFEMKNISLNVLFRGSTNQRIINLQETTNLDDLVFVENF